MISKKTKSPTNTLPFFPAGLPDETIGSRISRYHILRGQPTAQSTYKQLFERAPFSMTCLVQPHLYKLAKKLPGSPEENLIYIYNDSTLLPLFQRFSGTQTETKNANEFNPSPTNKMQRRINGDSRLTNLCAQCLVDDEKLYGVPYIHRAHQIPGVTACWKHAKTLLDCCPSCRCPFAQPSQLILSAWLGCTCGYFIANIEGTSPEVPSDLEVQFARFSQTLLAADPIKLSPNQLAEIYKKRAIDSGYSWGDTMINRTKLFKEIETHFGPKLLSKIDPAYRKGKISGWFHILHAGSLNETPLNRHLILSYFLFRDASIFLSHAQSVLRSNCSNDENCAETSMKSIDRDSDRKHLPDELFEDLINTALKFGYSSKQLWHHNFGAMKRLAQIMPNAYQLIDERIFKVSNQKKIDTLKISKSKVRHHFNDVKWSSEILSVPSELYWEEKKPIKVTKHKIIQESNSLNGRSRLSWPSNAEFPMTNAAVNSKSESIWHFYARRILWTLQSLHDPETPIHNIVILTGLEVYKAKAVIEYFLDFPRCGGTSIEIIKATLSAHGIGIEWNGPCPEKEFYKAGRAYRLRTSRKGPIGGRAGDTQLGPDFQIQQAAA